MSNISSHVNKATNTYISVIPGGLTSRPQPADVSWNKPFKQAYKAHSTKSGLVSGKKCYTQAGNMRLPERVLCLKWVKEAWQSVTADVVTKLFVACVISANLDGSQGSKIG